MSRIGRRAPACYRRASPTAYCDTSRMPELPDIAVYIERLTARVVGESLQRIRLASPWVLRTFDPPVSEVDGKTVNGFRRIGKRIVFDRLRDNADIVMIDLADR